MNNDELMMEYYLVKAENNEKKDVSVLNLNNKREIDSAWSCTNQEVLLLMK